MTLAPSPAYRPTVLVVDDTPDNVMLLSALLKDTYKVKVVNSGERAIRAVQGAAKPDLVLLDIMMPGLSGYDVIAEFKANPATRDIPVIFLTAMTATEDEKKGLEMGASDYITKPISPPIVMARVKTQLENKAAADLLRGHNAYLEAEVSKRTRELSAIQEVTILTMASLAETRDSDTGNHIRRTQHYVKLLAEKLRTHPRFEDALSADTIEMLYKSSPLHDIGKVGIPDRILLKPGRLSADEFEIMKTHTTLGRNAIEQAEAQLGLTVEFLRLAKEIAYCHQEKWDGTGYPAGLRGDAIPVSARLMAVADVYDALISRRIYKSGMPHAQAAAIIVEGRGLHFDPDVVDAFVELQPEFRLVAERFADSDQDVAEKARQRARLRGESGPGGGPTAGDVVGAPRREGGGHSDDDAMPARGVAAWVGRLFPGKRAQALDALRAQVQAQEAELDMLRSSLAQQHDDLTASRARLMQAEVAIREAKIAAEDAVKAKGDFVSNMSHEIRTPMNAIVGMAHLALETDLTAPQRNYVQKIDSAAKSLLAIVKDVLDFSKIEAGRMTIERSDFYLEDVLEHLADLSVSKAQDKGLELLFDVGTEVQTALVGDPLRLGQVILNLVSNAIKFTEKGEVAVGVHKVADEPDGVRLRFDVRDTGIGIPAEHRKKLFAAFAQVDGSTTRKYGGTGLGLIICKRLVEMMGGEIAVASEPGVGSTFSFTGRFGVQTEQPTLSVSAEDVEGLRILVVDDNASAREILQGLLTSLKFSTTAVRSGAEAIAELEQAQLEHTPYGLVLMDWQMPGMDGLETVRRIHANSKLAPTPAFVMVTAYSRDELLQQAAGVQIDGMLAKPVSPPNLLDSILNALGKDATSRPRRPEKRVSHQVAANRVAGARLLLVEDNAVSRALAVQLLTGEGLRVDVAKNGAEAVEKVAEADYDGVLMDCQMPVMDGFEATRRIRQNPRFSELPIVAMTANTTQGDREECLAAGMDDHISKPIDVEKLFLTLARWIRPKWSAVGATLRRADTGNDTVPAIPGLDLDGALARVGGSATLLRMLLGRFAETQDGVVGRIRTAVENREVEAAVREAHMVKGLAGNIGAAAMARRAAQVEELLKRPEREGLDHALREMDAELRSLLTRLAGAFADSGAGAVRPTSLPAAPVDRAVLEADLRTLNSLLTDLDPGAGGAADGLASRLVVLGQGQAARDLVRLAGDFDYDSAQQKLADIALALGVALQRE
ncbi:MAG: response regulator [Acidobacteriota bacterium]